MKYYLAGPMTGIPQFNIPLFERVTADLRAAGYEIVSPVEMDSPAVRDAAMASPDGALHGDRIAGESWGEILARDVRVVADEVDGVIVLPGWSKSRGARLEVFVAMLCRKPVFSHSPGVLRAMFIGEIISRIMAAFFEPAKGAA